MTLLDAFVHDKFGAAVVERLQDEHRINLRDWRQAWAPSTWTDNAVVLLVSGTGDPRLEAFVNQVSFDVGRDWMPVVLEPRYLRVGPVVTSGGNGCFECFRLRQLQHKWSTDSDVFIEAARASGLAYIREASGYLPSHIDIAASLASRALQEINRRRSDENERGEGPWPVVYRSGLSYTRVEEIRITPVHNCSVCSPASRQRMGEATSVERLQALSRRINTAAAARS